MLNHLEEAMNQMYCQSNLEKANGNGKGDSNKKEVKILNVFDGNCYLCQKKGPKMHFCSSKNLEENAGRNGNNDNRGKMYYFTTTCYNCGKQGHFSRNGGKRKRTSTNILTILKQSQSNTLDENAAGELELLLICIDLKSNEDKGNGVVNCSVEEFDMVDCDVGL